MKKTCLSIPIRETVIANEMKGSRGEIAGSLQVLARQIWKTVFRKSEFDFSPNY